MHRIALAPLLASAAAALALAGDASATDRRLAVTAVDVEPADGRRDITDADLDALRTRVLEDPKDRAARFDLVRALIDARRLGEARAAAEAWREDDAYNLVVVRLLGDIYTELGDGRRALRAYSAVVELLPEDASAQRALASVLKQSGELQAAYERMAAAAALRPEDRRIAFELADLAHRLGKLDEAQRRLEEIAAAEDVPEAIRYPAKQRLAQVYGERRRAVAGDEAAAYDDKIAALAIAGGVENDIKIYLTWDTDRSDVDLWVTNPAGEKIYYEHKRGRWGGALFDDVTTGYGPESFTAENARPGTYEVAVNYYSAGRSRFPEARGEVVIVTHEGTAREQKTVLPYRLFRAKQTVTVARIEVQ